MTLMMLDSFQAHKPHFECFIDIIGHNQFQVVISSTLVVDSHLHDTAVSKVSKIGLFVS